MALTEHYTIPLPPVTKKNSSQIIFTGAKCPVCKRGRLARRKLVKQQAAELERRDMAHIGGGR